LRDQPGGGRDPKFPRSRIPSYPSHRGPLTLDVVIVGGGLTGCATALAFAAAGIKVALFEADRIGRGSGGSSAGWIGDTPGVSFMDAEKLLGRRTARLAWHSWRRAALDMAALIRRLDIKCQLEPRNSLLVATTPDQMTRMTREHKLRKEAGLEASSLNARAVVEESGLIAGAAIRSRDGATIDPYRATLGLAAAAAAKGAMIFEKTPVSGIEFTRKTADVITGGGVIRAKRIVIATGRPTPLFKALVRHFWFHASYFALTDPVPAAIRRALGKREAVVRDSAVPPHLVRWVGGDRLLVSGADGVDVPARLREKTIVQRTGQLMYELSTLYPDISGIMPAYGWEAVYARSTDGLPFIGPHRNFPHQLFAFGDATHSVTGSYLASRVLLRHYLGALEPADEVFGFR
jgi:glycine/D-amino acid oxidase-like deaminating enzyme